MTTSGRRKSMAFFIVLGAALIFTILLLYIGWILLSWRSGVLLFLGILLLALLITGVVVNTFFLVREIHRNEQKDAFINAVTHELKTPVASIRLYLETLQSRPVPEQRRQEFYRTMLEDNDRLLATIEQILRAGRIGLTSHKPNFSAVDLGTVVDECVGRARTLYHLPPESLVLLTGPDVTVKADIDEVRAAVSNLVDNAVKYSGEDVRVTVQTAVRDEEFAVIRVQDHGPGIDHVDLKDIFKRFHRIPGPLTSRVPGTGLGLHIVRSVAKRHGGRAWAESEGVGHGSTFILELPIDK